jgi:uncharacterized membrane protein
MNKNEFSTERINNFTDALFGIAITLLILHIKVPDPDLVSKYGAVRALFKNQLLQMIGLLVSFFVAALFWRAHLSLAKYISSYDNNLLFLNTILLFFVVIMTFSTAFYSRNYGYDSAFFFYCINLVCIGIMNFLMIRYTIKKEHLRETLSRIDIAWMQQRALIVPFVFLLSVFMSYASPLMGRLGFVLIFVFQGIGDRIVKNRSEA